MFEAIAFSSFIFAFISFGFTLFLFIDWAAQKKSRHVIQMVPADSLTNEEEEVHHPPSAFEEFDSPRRHEMEMDKLNEKLRNL